MAAPQQVQWGSITLYLDNETFQQSFTSGRSMYFDDREYDLPEVAHRMTTLHAAGSVLEEDGKGGYCFDQVVFKDPFDILGFFLGYMSGPILSESLEEYQERQSRIITLPEPALCTGRAS